MWRCGKLTLGSVLRVYNAGRSLNALECPGKRESGRIDGPRMLSFRVRHILCLLLISEGAAMAQSPASPSDPPAAAGVYYRQGETGWVALTRAVMADTRTQGMDRFLDTYGWSNLNRTMVFQGAEAGVRIFDHRPTFYVRGVGSARDVLIVQFAKKEGAREVQASSTNASVNNKEGFKRGSLYRVTTTVLAKDFYSITPEQNLKPGEYLLVFGHADTAFDFGIRTGPR